MRSIISVVRLGGGGQCYLPISDEDANSWNQEEDTCDAKPQAHKKRGLYPLLRKEKMTGMKKKRNLTVVNFRNPLNI